ncbi:hypothetical protein GBAR_LOCUS23945, partial [Geodia barretti]
KYNAGKTYNHLRFLHTATCYTHVWLIIQSTPYIYTVLVIVYDAEFKNDELGSQSPCHGPAGCEAPRTVSVVARKDCQSPGRAHDCIAVLSILPRAAGGQGPGIRSSPSLPPLCLIASFSLS